MDQETDSWVAREHIRHLAAVYCHRIAFGDVDGVVDLFVGDGGMHVLGELHSGHEALRKLYTESLEVRHIPHIHNHVVEVDGDTAEGQLFAEIVVIAPKGIDTIRGWYHDDYRKSNGTWKFACRKFFSFDSSSGS